MLVPFPLKNLKILYMSSPDPVNRIHGLVNFHIFSLTLFYYKKAVVAQRVYKFSFFIKAN